MPSSLPQIAAAVQQVLIAVPEQHARACGFTQRASKLRAAVFVQTVVLGWLGNPQASLSDLAQVATKLGTTVSPQALAQPFTAEAAVLLEAVLAAAIGQAIAAEPVATELLGRFTGVEVLDSSTIRLPDGLRGVWAGWGGRVARGTAAALKLTVRFDLRTGRLVGSDLSAGRAQDRASALQHAAGPAGSLRLADLGFWCLAVFRRIGEQRAFWLSRLDLGTSVWLGGDRLDLPRWLAGQGARVDRAVDLGVTEQLPARLLGVRVPPAVAAARRRKLRAAAKREGRTPPAAKLTLAGWTLLVTNVPPERLRLADALVLARARWQIELLFKPWKSHGGIDESRSANPQRRLCEV